MLTVKFTLSYVLISISIIFLSKYLGYFDKPNNRRTHTVPTMNTGGLILYLFF